MAALSKTGNNRYDNVTWDLQDNGKRSSAKLARRCLRAWPAGRSDLCNRNENTVKLRFTGATSKTINAHHGSLADTLPPVVEWMRASVVSGEPYLWFERPAQRTMEHLLGAHLEDHVEMSADPNAARRDFAQQRVEMGAAAPFVNSGLPRRARHRAQRALRARRRGHRPRRPPAPHPRRHRRTPRRRP